VPLGCLGACGHTEPHAAPKQRLSSFISARFYLGYRSFSLSLLHFFFFFFALRKLHSQYMSIMTEDGRWTIETLEFSLFFFCCCNNASLIDIINLA
jgi:hypothetical protein